MDFKMFTTGWPVGRFLALLMVPLVLAAGCGHTPGASMTADGAGPVSLPAGVASPRDGIVKGLVVALMLDVGGDSGPLRGFVLQSPTALADGDPATSDGLFVAMGTNRALPSVNGPVIPHVGDDLVLRGNPVVLQGNPALADAEVVRVKRRGVDLDREVPAFDANPPSDEVEAAAYWAARHGMRCRVPAGAVVQGSHYGDYGKPLSTIMVIRPDHPLQARENVYARRVFRDAHPLDDQPERLFDNGNGFLIALGDGAWKAALDEPAAMLPLVRTFDQLKEPVVGVVLKAGDRYRVHAPAPIALLPGLRPDLNVPAIKHTRAQLRVATFNIENLYDHRDDPFDPEDDVERDFNGSVREPRRLQNYVPASAEEYARKLRCLAAQIVQDLESPDVLMVQEVEDQDIGTIHEGRLEVGPVNNRDGRLDALQELAVEIVSLGGPLYTPVADRAAADSRGIVCAFLFRDDRLRLSAVADDHPVMSGVPQMALPADPTVLAYAFGASNPRALNASLGDGRLANPRAVQVACFQRVPGSDLAFPAGKHLYLVNNHFKSRPQGYVVERREQARSVGAIAAALMKADPEAGVIVGGDLNTFPRPDEPLPDQPGDQLGALYEAGLINLHDWQLQNNPAGAYTYVFSGQAQTIDHLFISRTLAPALIDVHALHINADYSPDPRAPTRHASDHDPVLAVFEEMDAPLVQE